MTILALETAGPTASVACMREGALLMEITLQQTQTHSETMMGLVETMLRVLHISPGELSAIAVDHGPGSFTGVRIGVCTANGMGDALSIPVVGVDSLLALYEPFAALPMPVCAMIDARNACAFCAIYQGGQVFMPPVAMEVEALLRHMKPGTLFVGDGAKAYRQLTCEKVSGAQFVPESASVIKAGSLCSIAKALLEAEGIDATRRASPVYLRPSQAERMWQKRQEGVGPQ